MTRFWHSSHSFTICD